MTTFFGKTNNATSAVADVAGIDGTSDPVTFNVTTGEGSLFPASNFKITIDNEILLCTSRTGDALTCSRASEGTTIAAHTQNADVEHRITAATLTEYETLSKMQGMEYAADAGSTDAYAVTLAPAPTAYFTGMVVKFKANTLNTGAATLNVNSLGAKDIKKNYNSALATGDILANQLVSVMYDGTNFQMLSPSAATLTSASNNVLDTGWTNDTGATWTYASATSINVADGTMFQKGDRIKLTQTTAKYFVVTGVSSNVVSVTGGTDYTVANAAITTQQYSHQANPLGFPTSFAYSATWSCSGSMTISVGTVNFTRFSVVGNRCTWTVSYSAFTLGGTQSTDIYATLPISSSRSVSGFANDASACQIVNGGTSSVGSMAIKDSDVTKGCFRVNNSGATNWTLGTTNGYVWGQLVYEF